MNQRASQVNNKLVHELDSETMVIEAWGRDGLQAKSPPMRQSSTSRCFYVAKTTSC